MTRNFKRKWLYFGLSIAAYFLPFIVVTAVFFPMIEAADGVKIAMGMGVVLINTIPFLMGIYRAFFAHFPMLNVLSVVFLCLAVFFTQEVFRYYVEIFCWIEAAAAIGSIASCILWAKFRKYAHWRENDKWHADLLIQEGKDK